MIGSFTQAINHVILKTSRHKPTAKGDLTDESARWSRQNGT